VWKWRLRQLIMFCEKAIEDHYYRGDLLREIRNAVAAIKKTSGRVTIDDFSSVDEFHIGGRAATDHLVKQLGFSGRDHLLDVGCGLGGGCRFVAATYQNRVTGIDLTREYIETGSALCAWVGLDNRVDLRHGSILSMPFENDMFDGGFMLHVGMNIENKARLFDEVYRVMRHGAPFGVFDIMQTGDGAITFPVPWATVPGTNHLATPDQYKQAMRAAGFKVSAENNRRDYALSFFKKAREKNNHPGNGPPRPGLHTLIGRDAGIKVKNMLGSIRTGHIAPVEIIAQKY
jgi:cyclopropane fatty-acyl-phospholipid synthase-like methyltransferase